MSYFQEYRTILVSVSNEKSGLLNSAYTGLVNSIIDMTDARILTQEQGFEKLRAAYHALLDIRREWKENASHTHSKWNEDAHHGG